MDKLILFDIIKKKRENIKKFRLFELSDEYVTSQFDVVSAAAVTETVGFLGSKNSSTHQPNFNLVVLVQL